MREAEVSVRVIVEVVMGPASDEAVVRKVVFDDQGMVIAKYGLASWGEWILVGEGNDFMKCVLDVRVYNALADVPRVEASLRLERVLF